MGDRRPLSSAVAGPRRPHNPLVGGSNPPRPTPRKPRTMRGFLVARHPLRVKYWPRDQALGQEVVAAMQTTPSPRLPRRSAAATVPRDQRSPSWSWRGQGPSAFGRPHRSLLARKQSPANAARFPARQADGQHMDNTRLSRPSSDRTPQDLPGDGRCGSGRATPRRLYGGSRLRGAAPVEGLGVGARAHGCITAAIRVQV
jgi:hypothetical protein